MKKNLLMILLAVVLTSYFTSTLSTATAGWFSSKKDNVERFLEEMVEETNKYLPQMLDEDILVTHLSSQKRTVTYNNKYISILGKDVDHLTTKSNVSRLLKMQLCARGDVVKILNIGATYIYTFRDMHDIYMFSVKIDKNDCL